MNPTHFAIGDVIDASPIGPGVMTGQSQRGYPQVNDITVACMRRVDGAIFDPHGHYENGVPEKDLVKQ